MKEYVSSLPARLRSAIMHIGTTWLVWGVGIGLVASLVSFFPWLGAASTSFKTFILVGYFSALFLVWILNGIARGGFVLPRSPVLGIMGLAVLATLISTIFSPAFAVSFWGYGIESGTFITITVLTIAALLGHVAFLREKSAGKMLLVLAVSFGLLSVLTLVRFFGGEGFMKLNNVLATPSFTFIGSWTNLGALAVMVLGGYIWYRTFAQVEFTSRVARFGTYVTAILALAVIALVNSYVLWVIVGLIALFALIYQGGSMSRAVEDGESTPIRTTWFNLVVFLIAMVMMFFSGHIASLLTAHRPAATTGVTPTVAQTLVVSRAILAENPVVGFGPNQFSAAWDLHRPFSGQQGSYQSIQFVAGFSFFGSVFVTTGLLGLLAWISLLVFYGGYTISYIRRHKKSIQDRAVTLALMSVAWIFLVLLAVTNLSVPVLFAGFVVLGMSLRGEHEREPILLALYTGKRTVLLKVVIAIALVVIVLGGLYITLRHARAFLGYQKITQHPDASELQTAIDQVVGLYPADAYLRLQSLIYQNKLTAELARQGNALPAETISAYLRIASGALVRAIEFDGRNYQNWYALASMYQYASNLGITDAEARVNETLDQVLARNPGNVPAIVGKARATIQEGDIDTTAIYLQQAFIRFPQYAQLYDVLALVVANNQDDPGVIRSVLERSATYNPRNAVTWLRLGILGYAMQEYNYAVQSLETSLRLTPSTEGYTYLIMSYEQLGRTDEAQQLRTYLEQQGISLPETAQDSALEDIEVTPDTVEE